MFTPVQQHSGRQYVQQHLYRNTCTLTHCTYRRCASQVEGLDNRTSWQDLKDFARRAGNVTYSDVSTDRGEKVGVIKYPSRDEAKAAVRVRSR